MNRLFALSAAAAALMLTPAAMAKNDSDEGHLENAAAVTTEEATPVKLVEWTGDWELMKTSRRLRVWRSHLAYKLTVSADGEVTNCELTESFRMQHVTNRLCSVLSEHHIFVPAHDADGEPIQGSYTSRISYADVRERL